jgi:UDP-2,3-diacylglucosamine pyrophosphatase LpxH
MKDFRPRLKGNKLKAYKNLVKKENRVLIIGDLHEPFCLDGYLEFCKEQYSIYNCNKVIFIGDVIDSHYSSYHETDPDGIGGGQELDLAIKKIKKFYKAFPKATVTIGNHDRIIMRKAFSSAIPKKWLKDYKDVLEVPKWDFTDRIVIDNVQYIHGEAGTARTKAKADMMSTVQGHLHTQAYVEHFVGSNYKIFAMQVGCGIDHDSYAMAYAKRGRKPAIGCGIVIGGHTGINCLMSL